MNYLSMNSEKEFNCVAYKLYILTTTDRKQKYNKIKQPGRSPVETHV